MFLLKNKLYLILLFLPFLLFSREINVEKLSSLNGSFYEVGVKNSYIYAASNNGVEIFNAKNLNSIQKESIFSLNEKINAVLPDGDYLYLGTNKGIYIVDIKDKKSPFKLSFLALPNKVTGLDLKDNTLYVSDGEGIKIIDISSKNSPSILGSFKTVGEAFDIKIKDLKAYVADGEDGVLVLDISNPSSISEIGKYESNSTASKISLSQNEAFVSYGKAGFRVIDITNPTNLKLTFDCDGPSHNCYGTDIIALNDGKTVYILDKTTGVKVANVITPKDIHLASEYKQLGEAVAMDYEDGKIYIANKDTGIQIIDVSDKFHANRISYIENVKNPIKADAKENFLYIADIFGGFDIIDFTDPKNLKVILNIELGCMAESVVVDDKEDYAFVTDFCRGLHIVDIKDKNNPKEISILDTPGRAYDVKIAGNRVYIADRSKGVEIVDIKDLKNPKILGSAATNAFAMGVDVNGYLYVADYNDTLSIFDIKNPKNPAKIGSYDTDESGYAIDVINVEDYTYLANYAIGMQIIDTKDPKNPSLVSIFDLNSSTSLDHGVGIDVFGDLAFIAYKDFGVAIVDVEDKNSPSLLKVLPGADVEDVKVLGSYLIACDKGNGVLVYKMQNDENIESFVKRLYTKLLNREFDKEGLNYYKNRLLRGASAAEISEIFYQSEEFKNANLTTQEFLNRTYRTLLGRDPDTEGLNYWSDLIDNKHIPREVVFYRFITSFEFKNLSKNYGISAFSKDDLLKSFVKRMYLIVLNREYDGEGLEFWFENLKSGERSARDIVFGFFDSDEFKSRNLSDRDFVLIAYRAIMNREGSDEDVNFWVNYLKSNSRDALIREFVNSKEFEKIARDYGIANI